MISSVRDDHKAAGFDKMFAEYKVLVKKYLDGLTGRKELKLPVQVQAKIKKQTY